MQPSGIRGGFRLDSVQFELKHDLISVPGDAESVLDFQRNTEFLRRDGDLAGFL
jgi:hypothetical protein